VGFTRGSKEAKSAKSATSNSIEEFNQLKFHITLKRTSRNQKLLSKFN